MLKPFVFTLFILCVISLTDIDSFTCLGNDKKVIKFANNANKVVPQYQARIMMGGYATQQTLNYAAYIFMREKIGMNVTFYPTTDPDDIWLDQYWMRQGNYEYPANYWWWLANDDMDMNFEYWLGQGTQGSAQEFYANGSAIDGGFVGTYGEVGLYIPKYLINEYPTIITPHTLLNTPAIQTKIRDGPKNGTETVRQILPNGGLIKYIERLRYYTGCLGFILPQNITCDGDVCDFYEYFEPTSTQLTTTCSYATGKKTRPCKFYGYTVNDPTTKAISTDYDYTLNCTVDSGVGKNCVPIIEQPNKGYGIIAATDAAKKCDILNATAANNCVDLSSTTSNHVIFGNTHKKYTGTGVCLFTNLNDTKNYTTGNYYDYFHINLWDVIYTSSFDTPEGNDKPVIWGSKDSYLQSAAANEMTKTTLNNAYDFASLGLGEAEIYKMVTDLYSRRMAFIANIYVPDDNFATTDPLTGSLQDFDKVYLPRNKDSLWDDPCFLRGECQFPLDPLLKAANPKLIERYPEAYEFFLTFNLPASQMAYLENFYLTNKANTTMSESEKWLDAACQWLKSSESVTLWNNSRWLIDVQRYDCSFGCGLPKPGDEGNYDMYIGGTCNYFTGSCVCNDKRLFTGNGRSCNVSCPGLVGPYLNSSNLWTFDYCNDQGECNHLTEECTCNLGYGGDGCERKYKEYKFPVGMMIVFIIFSFILVTACILCIIWLRSNAKYKTVKALSIDMTTVMTIGLAFISLSNVFLIVKTSAITCIIWQWLFGLGGVFAILSPLLKAYRVSCVFHGGKMLKAVKITDKMLMTTLIKCALIELILCILYTIFHQITGEKGTVIRYNHELERTEAICNNGTLPKYIKMGSFAYFAIVLLLLTYYSYGTRRALSVFKESTCAYFSSFLSLFCTFITFIFNLATDDPTFQNSVFSGAVVIVVTGVLILFYGTRIYTFYTEPENRDVTDARASTATSKSFTSSVMKPGPNAKA